MDHLPEIVQATDLPVNADFEDGRAADLDELAGNIRRCIETGVAGLSIEDATGRPEQPLYGFDEAVTLMRAARRAIDATDTGVMLIGRAECFLLRHPDPLNEAIRRLTAYAGAGADCLYAPGLRTREDFAAVVQTIAPKPVNVPVGRPIGPTVAELAELGVRRISVGGALALAAWSGFMKAAQTLAGGRFEGLAGNASHAEMNALFVARPEPS